MNNFLEKKGFFVQSIVGDNPIDLNLLNQNSNYVEDSDKGKHAHYFRVITDNFLASVDIDKLLDIREIMGSMGVGRNLIYFAKKR